MTKQDYYETLNVNREADAAEIKKAYRKMAGKYHPDRNPGDAEAEERFKEASEAYEVLTDDSKRNRYDQFGHAGMGGAAGGGGAGFNDINDIFSRFSDIFGGGGFEDIFGGGRTGRRRKGQRGGDLRVRVKLTLEEIAQGVEKKLKLRRQVTCSTCNGIGAADDNSYQTCPTCNGHGEVRQQVGGGFFQQIVVSVCPTCHGEGRIITKNCPSCGGEGRVEEVDEVSVRIPAGVSDQMQLSLRGQGHAGRRGGQPGDLLILIEEEPHEQFVREGDNIIHELYINLADAALGMKANVPTLTGKANFKIEPGTQSGKIVRLRGKGIPNLDGRGTGDLLVHINVWTPKKLSSEEKAILEKLRESPNFQPKPGSEDKGFFERVREFFA